MVDMPISYLKDERVGGFFCSLISSKQIDRGEEYVKINVLVECCKDKKEKSLRHFTIT